MAKSIEQYTEEELKAALKAKEIERLAAEDALREEKRTEKEKRAREAMIKIEEKTKAAYALIKEAEAIADEAQVAFSFSLEYGMGGTYYPKRNPESTEATEGGDWYDSYEGWQSSSSQC